MSLKVLIAPNSFKGSASAEKVYRACLEGVYFYSNITSKKIETRKLLICDGGTGFADIISNTFKNRNKVIESYNDPLHRRIDSYYYLCNKTAIVESATVIGHALLNDEELNPLYTSSYGLGEMIASCIDNGAKKILIGFGDTATCDCGIGMLSALGVTFKDQDGLEIQKPVGKDLLRIEEVDFTTSKYLDSNINIEVACNLSSIAAGKNSTALIYSKQKGANDKEAKALYAGITKYTNLVCKIVGEPSYSLLPGSGAAGGIAFSLFSFFRTSCLLKYSFDLIFERIGIDEYLKWADIVITGEGLFDRNSVKGKAPVAVALRAKLFEVTPIAIVGGIQANITSRTLRSGFEVIEPFSSETISKTDYMDRFDDIARDATVRALLKVDKSFSK